MHYEFPILDDIQEVLKAIEGRDEITNHFKMTGIGGHRYGVIDYQVNFADTFPDLTHCETPEDRNTAIVRRECRGIIYDPDSGAIISRPYHKFHNCGERDETQPNRIDLNRPHVLMDKLDGSMVRAWSVPGNGIRYAMGTRAGETEVSNQAWTYVNGCGDGLGDHSGLILDVLESGYTPIFEWCSRRQRIVLDYPEDRLLLTAIRHNRLGTYLGYDEMIRWAEKYRVPVVPVFETESDIRALIDRVRPLVGVEGFVIRFDDGHMLKLKADHYVRLHRTRDALDREKDVIGLILNNQLDDLLPDMSEELRDRVERFGESLHATMKAAAERIAARVEEARQVHADKKSFAISIQKDPERSFLFSVWDGKNPNEVIRNSVLSNLGTQTKVESIRNLIGPSWYNT